MSCIWSKKFEPFVVGLVKEVRKPSSPITEEQALEKLITYFGPEDGQIIYNTYFVNNGVTSSFTEYEKVQEMRRRFSGEQSDDEISIRANYVGDFRGYSRMITEFKRRMIQSSVYNIEEGRFVNADETIDGISVLNRELFAYKVELVNTLLKELGRTPISIDINSEDAAVELTKYINLAKTAYESSAVSYGNWDAYVILTHFNDLIAEQTPFIKLHEDYKNKNGHIIEMYVYDGPHANLRQTWSKEDEIPSAESQYSGLAKILLSCLPEVTDDGKIIENTSIEASGFASVMATLRSAILYSTDPQLSLMRAEYAKGAQANVAMIIQAFSNYLAGDESFKKPYYTYLRGKLNGISKFIYGGNMQEDIKQMFTRMFQETVPLSYMQYGYFGNEFKGATIKERWILNQNYQIQKILNGRISNFRLNPKAWSVIKNTYKITFDPGYNSQAGDISLVVKNMDKKEVTLVFHYQVGDKNGTLEITPKNDVTRNFTEEAALTDLIYKLTGYLLTPEYTSYMNSRHVATNHEILDDFAPAIGLVIMASDPNHTNNPITQRGYINAETNTINFNKIGLYNALNEISSIDSLIKGSETNNTVRDVNGNNLPTRGITSLAYQLRDLHTAYKAIPESFSPAHYNLTYLNLDLLAEPIVREGITIEGRGKKSRQLLESELYECAIAYDFLEHLVGDGIIYLQNDTFADKSKHFLWGWNLKRSFKTNDSELGDIDLLTDLKHIYSGVDRDVARDHLLNIYKTVRKNQYSVISDNIVAKYNKAFGTSYSTLEEVDNYLVENQIKYAKVKQAFEKLGKFTDEYDAVAIKTSKNDKNPLARINETLLNLTRTFLVESNDRAKERLNRSQRRFLMDLIDSGFVLNRYSSKGGSLVFRRLNSDANETWINQKSGNVILAKVTDGAGNIVEINRHNVDLLMDKNLKVELNPVLESYFFADVILSNDLSDFMTGATFVHAKKSNDGDPNRTDYDETEYEEFSEATRLIAKIKRNVIPGASMHTMLPGMKYGVAEKIKLAIMEDIPGSVWNMFGLKDKVDSSDGSGISNIYEAMAERNSLIDAATGLDMKTIGWDVDPETFIPMMLKWAVYATTNERRRHGIDSEASWEDLHKRLNSDSIRWIDVSKYYRKVVDNNNFYIYNNETGKTYKITGIEEITVNNKKYFYKKAVETDNNGTIINTQEVALDKNNNQIEKDVYNNLILPDVNASLALNTIYDIDIFFGGAYNKKLNNKGKLVWGDFNNRITFDIICSEKLKNKMIAYAVNKSAFKVGYGNVNSKNAWFDSNIALKTIEMSTRHIGLQMNAEHDLLNSEVTEMTQMISALAENWYAGEIVKQIYKDIGAVVDESLRNINAEIKAKDMDALRVRLGKALIDAFKTKEDTIGLAQAFLAKAEIAMAESNASVKIPFSAATINGTFVSTIVSMLNKKGIRRKYAGVAAVLTPSYNMMQYYRYNGKTLLHAGVSEDIRKFKQNNPNFSNVKIRDFIRNRTIIGNDGLEYENPFLENIVIRHEIKQEDTLFVFDPEKNNWEKIRINTYDAYNTWVNKPWKQGTIVKRLTIAPRDLMGADTEFTINQKKHFYDGQRFSIYNLVSVQAAHGDIDAWAQIYADKHWIPDYAYNPEGGLDISQTLKNIIQHQLKDLDNGFIWDPLFGNKAVRVSDVKVNAAEVIMGRLNADKFGLEEGDQVQDILDQGYTFFYNRWKNNYGTLSGVPEQLYDIVLYTKNGPILVKIGDTVDPRLTRNRKIEILDDKFVYNGNIICSAEGKKKFTYLANNSTEYNVIVINSSEALDDLLDSDIVDTYKVNLTKQNLVWIGKYFDPKGNFADKDSALKTWGQLNTYFETQFEEQQVNLAKQRYESFKQSLNLVGARIPTQAMQSFMPLRVIAFTDDLTNVIYVPRMQTWLEGSDYDIDKLYILSHSIASNGTLPTLSGLSRLFSPAETLRLPVPDGRRFVESDKGYRVSLADLDLVTGLLSSAKYNGWNLFNPGQLAYKRDYRLEVFRKILQHPNTTRLSFERPTTDHFPKPIFNKVGKDDIEALEIHQNRIYEQAKTDFINLLNKHSLSKFRLNREDALRNNVTFGIFNATTKAVNQINAHAPIEMDEVDDAASMTAMSRMEKHVSSDIPSTKFKVQVQAGVGKDVTGITAVSVKVFFAETTYFNDVLSDVIANIKTDTNQQDGIDILERLVMYNPIYGTPALIANANIKSLIEKLGNTKILYGVNAHGEEGYLSQWNDGPNFKIYDCLKYFDKQTSIVDAALSESGLLSSATDNMKHLYLPKLNATAQFVDMYTTMITHGVKLKDIANVLTSPLFTAVSKLCQYNIFRNETQGYSIDRALGFYLNEDTLPHVNKGLLAKAFALTGIQVKSKDVLELLAYNYPGNTGNTDQTRNKTIKNVLNQLYDLRFNRFSGGEDAFFDDYFAGYDTGELQDWELETLNLSNASLQTINTLINFLEECIIRNNTIYEIDNKVKQPEYAQYKDAAYQLNRLKTVKDYIIPKTEEQRIFGQMLGINQGIRTDAYSIYSLIRRIENHVNNLMEESQKAGKISEFEPFELYSFLNPDEAFDDYRQQWIDNYDKIKASFNILHAIRRVPHFSKMFDVLYTNNWILSNFSAKYEIVNAVAREIEKRNPYITGKNFNRVLKENEYKQVEHYVNDVLIMGWLSKQDFKYILSKDSILYDIASSNKTEAPIPNQGLRNQHDFATFKYWMEHTLIPNLQEDPNFKDNFFVKSLEYVSDENKVTKRTEHYYRLPINMMTIEDSVKTQAIYDSYLRAFDEIQHKTVDGIKVADLFFIYNLIVNKDGYGQDSFTRVFENLVSQKNSTSLVESFYDYISQIDANVEGRDTIIKTITNPDIITDVEDRIVTYVKGSNIKGNSHAIANMNSDYTFGAPNLNKNWNVVKNDIFIGTSEITTESTDPIKQRLSVKINPQTVRIGILTHLKEILGDENVQVHTSTWFEEHYPDDPLVAKASAFIDNGVLYVRSDSNNAVAATVHEIAHYILAGMRFNKDKEIRNLYFDIISKIDTNEYKQILGDDLISEYEAFRTPIDIKEEIFVKMVEMYFSKSVLPKLRIADELRVATTKFHEIFNEMFGSAINSKQFFGTIKQLSNSADLFAFVAKNIFALDWMENSQQSILLSQKVADLRNRLRRANRLDEVDCI